ncbi:fibronectin type III domain-containing protein [Paenibacillus ginsengarvi]|nr:fibronectin type III domain-containing protein [Paenibacillus ginsengarvi]
MMAHNGFLYVAWAEGSPSTSKIQLRKYNGTTWTSETIDSLKSNSGASYPAFSVYNNELYLTWSEQTLSPNAYYLPVIKRPANGVWENVSGTNGISDSMAMVLVPQIQAYNGLLYVVWKDNADFKIKAYGGNGWSNVGDGIFPKTPGFNQQNLILTVFHNKLFASWLNWNMANPSMVVKAAFYDGASWTPANSGLESSANTYEGSFVPTDDRLYLIWGYSGKIRVSVYKEGPPAPAGVQVTRNGNDSATLSWTVGNGITEYKVYMGTQAGTYGSASLATVPGTDGSYTATGLEEGKTYYFAVKANNADGDSSYSEEVSVSIPQRAPDLTGINWGIGSTPGTTRATVLPGTGTYKYAIDDPGTLSQPMVGDDATAVYTETLQKNVDFTMYSGKRIYVVEVDGSNRILKWASIPIADSLIAEAAPPITGLVWGPGSVPDTTRIIQLTGTGTYRYVLGTAGSITHPVIGANAVQLGYMNSLVWNSNIPVTSGQHLFAARIDDSNRITAWSDFLIVDEQIAKLAPSLNGLVWGTGTLAGTTRATLLPGSGTYKYAIGEAGEYEQPIKGEDAEALNYLSALTLNGNIPARSGQHLYVVEVDSSDRILKWTDIAVTDNQIATAAPALSGIVLAKGTTPGTTKVIQLPGGSYNYVIGGAGSFTQPVVGADAAVLGYTQTLTANSNMEASNGQYLYVVEVDGSNRVLKWTGLPIADDQITEAVTPVLKTPAAGDGQVTLSWNQVDGATGYKIFVSTTSGQYGAEVATVGGSVYSHEVTGLANGTTYYFVIKANYVGVDGPSSNEKSATPQAALPGVPVLKTTAAGDGQVTLSWNPVSGALGYKVYVSTTSGQYGAEVATVGGSVYSHPVTGLTNGTTYYFVLKAINTGGDSAASNEKSATPQASLPGVPVLQAPAAGNGQVTLSWNPVSGALGYKIYVGTTSGQYGSEAATVGGSVYGHSVTGLANGTTYYFVVKAKNTGGDSAASNETSAVPGTVPSAPYEVAATAGNGQATVAFKAPTDNGGFAVTGYEVTASPGSLKATGTASPIVVTGLTNGTAYTFTVKAINQLGGSAASESSGAVTPSAPSSGGSGEENSSPEPSAPSTPSVPSTPTAPSDKPDTAVIVYVNGKAENAGMTTTTTVNDRQVTTVTLDPKKLDEKLAAEGTGTVITIPVTADSATIVGELNGRMVKSLEQKEGIVKIQTPYAIYSIPASQINIDAISEQLGKTVALENITIRIEVAVSASSTAQVVRNAAANDELTVVIPPYDFTVRAVYGDQVMEATQFDTYVERMIALPEGIDPTRITTGVVLKADGTLAHVPTKVTQLDGKYYAVINSLTNSSYAVIYNVKTFDDIAGHWAKASIEDMASRLVVNGVKAGEYKPDQEITRAEFTAIVVRALGLRTAGKAPAFTDMKTSDWSYEAVSVAATYGLVQGYEDGTFGPDRKITRQEAMAILYKAMSLTMMDTQAVSGQQVKLLAAFTDSSLLSDWAASAAALHIRYGIIEGSGDQLRPQANMTRAETAAIVQRLLQKAGLI